MTLYPEATEDPRTRAYLKPTRIVWQSDGDSAPTGADNLLTSAEHQPYIGPGTTCTLTAGAGIVLDFGKELHGGLRIVTEFIKPKVCQLRVRFGESVSEVMAEPNNDHAIHDSVIDLSWLGGTECGNTGYRFARLDVPEGQEQRIVLRSVLAVALYRELEYVGSFRSNDEKLNEIWQTGAYTVHLNMQDYVWDGIKRDRLVWLGDLHPEVRVICAAFDDVACVQQSLDFARDRTPLPHFMNTISSYSLWWIINHRDWYLYRGDLNYLKEQQDYLSARARQLGEYVGEDGVETLPNGRFLDWPSSGQPESIHAGLQGLLTLTFEAAAELLDILGDDDLAAFCRERRSKLLNHDPPGDINKQATALTSLSGITDATVANDTTLAVDPFKGISTFYGYYVLQARAKAGDFQGALDVIRTYWGAMLDYGATTFWEDFDLDWTENAGRIDELPEDGKADLHADFGNYCYKGLRHSFCHGWAGGPTAWLSEYVLGIQAVEPGCKTVRISANLCDLEWVEGSFPTPYGPITVRHERQPDGTIKSDINLPDGVTLL